MAGFVKRLKELSRVKILVIGDLLLDVYTIGKAKRISPEAPVAVVEVHKVEQKAGGAGNVLLNLLSLGAEVVSMGRIGEDSAGRYLLHVLKEEGVETEGIVAEKGYTTPLKNRIIADGQQIVRVDHETVDTITEETQAHLVSLLESILPTVKLVAISDYGKGLLTPGLLEMLFKKADLLGIPVVTDPKGSDFTKYRGSYLIKPNLSEAYAAAKLPQKTPLESVASALLADCDAKQLMITRSESGISLFDKERGRLDFPVKAKEVKDVTGAGDTVLAMLAYALANDLSTAEAAELCNAAASLAVEQMGCARITLGEVAIRLFQENKHHKIFDPDHFFILKQLLKDSAFSLLTLNQVPFLTRELFTAIKSLAKEKPKLLIAVDTLSLDDPLIEMLTSLEEVRFITLKSLVVEEWPHLEDLVTLYSFDPLTGCLAQQKEAPENICLCH